MSDRPDYLVIIPPHGVFSSHWIEADALQMVAKLKSNGMNKCKFCGEEPFVVEVPETDGICSPWRLEEKQTPRPDEEQRSCDTALQQAQQKSDTNNTVEDPESDSVEFRGLMT